MVMVVFFWMDLFSSSFLYAFYGIDGFFCSFGGFFSADG